MLLHGDRRIACWPGLRDEAWKRLDQSFWTHGLGLLKVLGIFRAFWCILTIVVPSCNFCSAKKRAAEDQRAKAPVQETRVFRGWQDSQSLRVKQHHMRAYASIMSKVVPVETTINSDSTWFNLASRRHWSGWWKSAPRKSVGLYVELHAGPSHALHHQKFETKLHHVCSSDSYFL